MIAPNIGWLSTFGASSWLVISLFFLGFTFWVKRRLCPVTVWHWVTFEFFSQTSESRFVKLVTFPNQTAIFLDLGSWMSMVCIFVNRFFRIKRASIPLFGLTKVTWFCMVRPKILSDYQSISFWDLITTSNGHISTIQYTMGIWLIPRIGGKLARNIPIISNHTINVALKTLVTSAYPALMYPVSSDIIWYHFLSFPPKKTTSHCFVAMENIWNLGLIRRQTGALRPGSTRACNQRKADLISCTKAPLTMAFLLLGLNGL